MKLLHVGIVAVALVLTQFAITASAQDVPYDLPQQVQLSKLPAPGALNQADYQRGAQAWSMASLNQPDNYSTVDNGLVINGCTSAGCATAECAQCGGGCGGCHCSPWFFRAGGLIMDRDDDDHYYFSYDDTDESIQLLDPRDADMDWSGGFEARFGRYFDCGCKAVEAVYWGLFPDAQETALIGGPLGGNLNGIFNWDDLDYNGGNADPFVANAQAHRVRRDWDIHNVEVNLLGNIGQGSLLGCGCSRGHFNWLAGVRYFRFREDLQFASDTADTVFDGDPNELYYDIEADNHLVGFQIGGRGVYALSNCWSFVAGTKVGLYGNHIRHHQRIGGTAGTATVNNGPNVGLEFLEDGHKNDVSFLAEIDLGLDYQINRCWSANVGYRAVAITGVALPLDQIPSDLRGVNDLPVIASNGSLILHGAYAGATVRY